VDRFDGGHYQLGDAIKVRGASGRAGFLYLLHVDPRGEVGLLYPRAGQDNRIGSQVPFTIPGPKDNFRIKASRPAGTHRIKAVVTNRPLLLTGLVAQKFTWDGEHQGQKFRWHPAQSLVVQQLLQQYQRREPVRPEQVGGIFVGKLLGDYAQDEVAYYVGPRKDPGSRPKK
jgi:hypothetical protein